MGANYSQEQMLGHRPHVVYCKTCNEFRLTKVEYLNYQSRWNICIFITIIWMFLIIFMSILIFKEGLDSANYIITITSMPLLGIVSIMVCTFLFIYKDFKHYCTHCETYIGKFDPCNRQRNMMRSII